jgi:membrane-associated phospholipid phosphatase
MRAISPGALLVCYLGAGAVLLVLGRERVYSGGLAVHLVVLAAIAVATFSRRVPVWLAAWTPLIALLFLYTELPMLIRAAGHGRFYDMTVMSWETRIFDGQPAFEWAMKFPSRLLSETVHAAYLSYYAIIFSVPVMLWLRGRRREFAEAMFVLMLTFVACFVFFIAFPVEGPRYLRAGSAPSGPMRDLTLWLLNARSSQGTAFPSSHVAVATAQSLLAWWYFGPRALVVGLLTLGLGFGAVYGGFHYAIDVIVGAVFGGLLMLTGLELFALIDRTATQANATAPTNPDSPLDSGSSTSSSGTAST